MMMNIEWVDPEEVLSIPANAEYVRVIRDSWWFTNSEGKVGIYHWYGPSARHPMCNQDKRIVEMMARKHPETYGTGKPMFISRAYIKHECEV